MKFYIPCVILLTSTLTLASLFQFIFKFKFLYRILWTALITQLWEIDDKLLTPHLLNEIHPIYFTRFFSPAPLSMIIPHFPQSLGMQEPGRGQYSLAGAWEGGYKSL